MLSQSVNLLFEEEYVFAILFLIFWLVVYVLGKVARLKINGLDVKPFFIRYKSERFRMLLTECSSKWRHLWVFFSHISVFLGFGLIVFAMIFFTGNFIELLLLSGGGMPVELAVPGLTLSLYWLPYFMLAIVLTVLIHEAAHGVLALVEGANVKSAGALLLAIFPGGFVELDEKELKNLPETSKLKIFSAGASANILCGLVFFLILSSLFIQTPSGIVVLEVLKDGPLDHVGIGRFDVIYALNGMPIHTHQDLGMFMANVKPGERLIVSTSKGDLIITTIPSPYNESAAIIGIISPSMPYYPSRLGLGFFWDVQTYLILIWVFMVLVNAAVFNMLPIPLLDGDKFLQCLLQRFAGRGELVKKFFNIFSLFLIMANMTLSL